MRPSWPRLWVDDTRLLHRRTARRKEITDAIVANLRFIAEHVYDLGELERQTGVIEANLRAINDDENDLEKLEARAGKIAEHLRKIEEGS